MKQDGQLQQPNVKFRVMFQAFSLASIGFTWLGAGVLINNWLAKVVGGIIILVSFVLLVCSFRAKLASGALVIINNNEFTCGGIVYGTVAISALIILLPNPQDMGIVNFVVYSLFFFLVVAALSMLSDIVTKMVQSISEYINANKGKGKKVKLLFMWLLAKANRTKIVILILLLIWVVVFLYKLTPIGIEIAKQVIAFLLSWSSSMFDKDSNMSGNIIALLAFVVSMVILLITRKQLDLLRKQVFGELYNKAQVDTLTFILPEEWKCKHNVFRQTDEEINYGDRISLPVGVDCVLYIRWRWAASHNFVAYDIGIKEPMPDSPKISSLSSSFAQQIAETPANQIYQDWHGAWHIEFSNPRKMSKGDYFIAPITIRACKSGSSTIFIEIRVAEAPNYFGELAIECIDQPDEWARNNWNADMLKSA